MRCSVSGGAGAREHKGTLWKSQRSEIAVLFRNLSGLQNERSDDQAAKQEWVEEKGEVGTLSCITKFWSDITSERT